MNPTNSLSVNSPESLPQKIQKVKALLEECQVCFDLAIETYSDINFDNSEYEFNLCEIFFLSNIIYISENTMKEFFNFSLDSSNLKKVFEKEKNTNQFVYLAKQLNEKNIYKIGRTTNLDIREKTFKIGNLFVELIAYRSVKDSVKAEKYLHNYFLSKKISGEWFELEQKDIELLIKIFGFNYGLEG